MKFDAKKLRMGAIAGLASVGLTFSNAHAGLVGIVSNAVGGAYITVTGFILASLGMGSGPIGYDWKTFGVGAAATASGITVFPYNAYKIWKSDKELAKCKREHTQQENKNLQKQLIGVSNDVNMYQNNEI